MAEAIEEIVLENFPELIKDTKAEIKEAKQI